MDLKEYEKSINTDFNRHPWEQARLKILSFFINKSKKKNTILDIGSGDAYLSSSIAVKLPDSNVVAVDTNYSSTHLEILTKDKPSNFFLFADLLSFSNSSSKKSDIVILMDVLEHVEFPGKLLQQVCQTTDNTSPALLIITVPAYQILYSKHDEKLGHFKRYNRKELIQVLKKQSILVTHSGYCFTSLLIPRIFQILAEKIIRKDSLKGERIYNWKGGKAITFLLKSIFWIEFKISWYLSRIGIYIPGLTCYCLCQCSPLSSPAITKKTD